ncbi:MAG: anthranilate phosphoribosyltransferase [Nitrospinota bacterium]|nr:MAG: anthranilate phosphoribosyltransferase [Nitrospinota bacterium]
MIVEAIQHLVNGKDLSEQEAAQVMAEIMNGEATPAQIAAFLTALRIKGETIAEITGCARVMREKARRIHTTYPNVVDTCGTGGDGSHTFNISTIAALVVAAAGVPVAKHGNRSVSSKCGSADLLRTLGVNIELPPERVEACLAELGIAFLFAPLLHGAMKYAIGPRREIAIRTIFNILGPLTNPAGAQAQLLGVYSASLTEVLAGVLANLGSRRAFVVHGSDGLDEITLTGETKVTELRDREIKTYQITPEDFGLQRTTPETLKGDDPETNARIALEILHGKKGPQRDVVVLNAGFALVAGGGASSVEEGIAKASEAIDSGAALAKLEALQAFA